MTIRPLTGGGPGISVDVEDFGEPVFLRFLCQGPVSIEVSNLRGSPNATVSGVFLDEPSAFIGEDRVTGGDPRGVYGGVLRLAAGETVSGMEAVPAYAWAYDVTDPRGVASADGKTANAITYFHDSKIVVPFPDLPWGRRSVIAPYFLDWDTANERIQRVTLLPPSDGSTPTSRVVQNLGSSGSTFNSRLTGPANWRSRTWRMPR